MGIEMTNSEERLAHNLLWVWLYNQKTPEIPYSGMALDHLCMQTFECAMDCLVDFGLGHDDGWSFVINDRAVEIMMKEFD